MEPRCRRAATCFGPYRRLQDRDCAGGSLSGSGKATLVEVPTRELRRQTVEQFRTQSVLLRIGALSGEGFEAPVVHGATGRSDHWSEYEDADVVVGLPASVSPAHLADSPSADFFDLVIIDEAHHAPAATWLAILEHCEGRQLLLTATPHRRDRKRIPGKLVYYYPLRQALARGLYQPVNPIVLDVAIGATRSDVDTAIATTVLDVLAAPEHASSQLLVRANSQVRANELADVYTQLGLDIPVLHSGLREARQQALTAEQPWTRTCLVRSYPPQ